MLSELKKELNMMRLANGLDIKENCAEEENEKFKKILKEKQELPSDVFSNDDLDADLFYRVHPCDLSKEEIQEYIQLKKLSYLKTIKSSCIFFVVITVISLIVFVIGYSSIINKLHF